MQVLGAKPLQSMKDVAACYGELLVGIDQRWRDMEQSAVAAKQPPPAGLADPVAEQLRQVFYAPDAPANVQRVTGWGVLTLLPDRGAQADVPVADIMAIIEAARVA